MLKSREMRRLGFVVMVSLLVRLSSAAAGTVGVLADTVYDGMNSPEVIAAQNLGHTVELISAADWMAKTTADFEAYDALILGDPDCQSGTSAVAAAEANAAVWAAAVDGNVIVIGADPTYHQIRSLSGAQTLIDDGVAFALANGGTGAYVTLSCYYYAAGAGTPVDFLAGFGSFVVAGGSTTSPLNTVHIVASHPTLDSLTDADLSNWLLSVHENFETWPEAWPSQFEVFAIGEHSAGPYTSGDGTVGYPYILARGVIPDLCGDGQLNPGEECDDGDNDPGDGCDEACNLAPCDDDDGDGVCNPDDICVGDDASGDADGDGTCDDIDACPADPDNDADGDGICADEDNCPDVFNPDQADFDLDDIGDACDPIVIPEICQSSTNKRAYDLGFLKGGNIIDQAWNGIDQDCNAVVEETWFKTTVLEVVRALSLPSDASDFVACHYYGYIAGAVERLREIENICETQCILDGDMVGEIAATMYCELSIVFGGLALADDLIEGILSVCGEAMVESCESTFETVSESYENVFQESCSPYTNNEVWEQAKHNQCVYNPFPE